jgi:hypothetical protein
MVTGKKGGMMETVKNNPFGVCTCGSRFPIIYTYLVLKMGKNEKWKIRHACVPLAWNFDTVIIHSISADHIFS